MPSIRKVRKAFKRKNGLKEFSILFKFENRVIRLTPTMRKNLRRNVTELFRTNFAAWNVY